MSELENLRGQFNFVWSLAQIHLPALTDEACLWSPAPGAWNVQRGDDGAWRPDWSDAEPEPPPPVTIGWLTWHLIWWWSDLVAAGRREPRAEREAVLWPGSAGAANARLDALHAEWGVMLQGFTEADLDRPFAYPWREPRALRQAIAWGNSELMKNVAEIGILRLMYEASRR